MGFSLGHYPEDVGKHSGSCYVCTCPWACNDQWVVGFVPCRCERDDVAATLDVIEWMVSTHFLDGGIGFAVLKGGDVF